MAFLEGQKAVTITEAVEIFSKLSKTTQDALLAKLKRPEDIKQEASKYYQVLSSIRQYETNGFP